MKHTLRLLFLALLLVAPATSRAADTLIIKDEGVILQRASIINCVGAGITCTAAGVTATFTASGGVGSANTVEASVNLGTSGGQIFSVTVTGAAWVAIDSEIVCSMFATSADGQTVETYIASGMTVMAATRVAATGFDLWIDSPRGATGVFRVHCTGA